MGTHKTKENMGYRNKGEDKLTGLELSILLQQAHILSICSSTKNISNWPAVLMGDGICYLTFLVKDHPLLKLHSINLGWESF
jgi:hypothetical protein